VTRTADPYAVLGVSYAASRRPDPRIGAMIRAALGGARTVVNVGAGAGSYEPPDVRLTAVEPSAVMIGQRPRRAAPAVRAVAEQLPFPDDAFDAALAVLTVHHWRSASAGLAELRRVARAQVVLTWDPEITSRFWLLTDYLPQIPVHERGLACLDAVCAGLQADGPAGLGRGGEVSVQPVLVPADCTDGFLGAYWRRPEAYLRPEVRAAISSLSLIDQDEVGAAMRRLRADLASGRWQDLYSDLLTRTELDLGYRLVVSSKSPRSATRDTDEPRASRRGAVPPGLRSEAMREGGTWKRPEG
jgi:SAM-dependent methyltransferase